MGNVTAKVTDKTGEVLQLLRSPCVDFNRQYEKYWGCLFLPQKNGKTTVLAASQYYVMMAENIECDPKGLYFDFYDNCWKKESSLPYSPEELIKLVEINSIPLADKDGQVIPFGDIIFATNNLVNWLGEFAKPVIDKSRLIISSTLLSRENKEIKLTFISENGKLCARVKDIVFAIDDESLIPEALVTVSQSYKCVICEKGGKPKTADGKILVNVLEPYGRVNIGIKFSLKGFDPKYMDDWNALHNLCGEESSRAGIFPHNQIRSTNAISSEFENWLPIPTHLNTGMVYAAAKFLLLSPNKLMRFRITNKPNSNVLMESFPSGDDEPRIRIVQTTLNQSYGMQAR